MKRPVYGEFFMDNFHCLFCVVIRSLRKYLYLCCTLLTEVQIFRAIFYSVAR